MHSLNTSLLACLSALLLAVNAGCSGAPDGPSRYHISGTVTYKNEPVPRGKILLIPDASKGNEGPTTQVAIENGKYDSRTGTFKPPVAGPLIVHVEGFGPEVPDEELPAPLFPKHETTFEMPAEDTVHDITVPEN